MNKISYEEKERITGEYLMSANLDRLLTISNFIMVRLAKEAIDMNAESLALKSSLRPDGDNEARDIALVVFQKEQSENKLSNLASVLQVAPEMLEVLQELVNTFDYEKQAAYTFASKEIDQAKEIIAQAFK